MLAAFAAPALAQTKECNDEFKSATYQKWYDNRKDHQDVADQAAGEYLATCPNDDSPYATAIKKFHQAYIIITAGNTIKKQFEDAFKQKNYADQIRLGKQIVATDPDNSGVYIIMGLAGLGDASLLNDSAESAKKAIAMIEAGKPFSPLTTKDQALAYLNYVVGKAILKSAPADSIPYILKAARYESDLKKSAQLYLDLAAAYNDGPRTVLTKDYTSKIGPNQTETPESKLALANLNQVIDRQIDALARAAALADAANKKAIMDELTEIYKYRNKSDAGLNELVASVLSKPLPDIPTPLTSLPTPSSSTPATSGSPGTNGGTQTGTTGGAKTTGATGVQTSGQNKTGSASATGTGSAKPAASPTPSNKRPRSNHRRG
jgi:hypothetical protein